MCAWTTLASHLSKELEEILQILLKNDRTIFNCSAAGGVT